MKNLKHLNIEELVAEFRQAYLLLCIERFLFKKKAISKERYCVESTQFKLRGELVAEEFLKRFHMLPEYQDLSQCLEEAGCYTSK